MKKIHQTEIEYVKCFSEHYEDESIIRFEDDLIRDMYSHNLTYIKKDMPDEAFRRILQSEWKRSAEKGRSFLNIQFDFPFRDSLIDLLDIRPREINTYDYYGFPLETFPGMKTREDCTLRKLEHSILEEAAELDHLVNGEDLDDDFSRRRFERRSQVYLKPGMVDNYLLFSDHQAIGHCDLFIHGEVAKIEDFDIAPHMQRKGFGSAMLKEIIKVALNSNAETIYLITDHAETAKEMYEKCGMIKLGAKTEMMFSIS